MREFASHPPLRQSAGGLADALAGARCPCGILWRRTIPGLCKNVIDREAEKIAAEEKARAPCV